VDVVAAIVLFPFMRLEGLALAIGLGAWAEVFLLVAFMERRIGFDLRPIARHAAAFVGGALVASAAGMVAARSVEGPVAPSLVTNLLDLAAGGLVSVIVYLAWSKAFRLPELDAAMELAHTLMRRGRAVEEADED
jgi:peptidoglycan biosynthesis protein MviN/MurJ (putative lipid II flippase)